MAENNTDNTEYEETDVKNPILNAQINYNANKSQYPNASGGFFQNQNNMNNIPFVMNNQFNGNNNNQMMMNNQNQMQNFNQNFQNNISNNNNMQFNNFNNNSPQISKSFLDSILTPYEAKIKELEEKLLQKDREISNLKFQLMNKNSGNQFQHY